MWIKHNNALYHSDHIVSIKVCRSKLKAKFIDGTEEIIGEFRATKECEDIYRNIAQKLLFDGQEVGVMIRDTKVSRKGGKKNDNKSDEELHTGELSES